MIKRIVDITFDNWHEHSVASAIDKLQNTGYIVTRVDRVRRMVLGFFGTNITEIHYESALPKH